MKKIIFSLAATAMFSVSALANPTTPTNKELQKDNSKTITVSTTSNDDGDEYQTNGRPMFGTRVTDVVDCELSDQRQPDGSPLYNVTYVQTTYVFWIGIPSIHQVTTSTCNLVDKDHL